MQNINYKRDQKLFSEDSKWPHHDLFIDLFFLILHMVVTAGRICSVVGNSRWEQNSKDLIFNYLCEADRN